jgi:ABC-type antimicrobial peptide transport system permease subunit
MIFKNLLRRGTRSALTLLGIAIGVAAVVALGAIAEGLSTSYATVVGGGNNDLLITQADALDPVLSNLDETIGQRLQGIPGVDRVEPGIYTWVATEELPFFLIFGYDPSSVAAQHYRIVEGKPVITSGQIAIGRRGAESIGMGVGDSLRIYGAPYRIVGIYETGQAMEESGGILTLADAQSIAQFERKVSLYQIGLRRGTDVEEVIARIDALDLDLSVSRTSEREANQQWDETLRSFAWGISAIAVLIGGLGMMNAMVMSVLERTREIGTLRAVGWSRRRVMALILGEALLLSFGGGLGGVLLGIGLTEAAGRLPGVGMLLEGTYSVGIFIQGLGTAFFLGLLGGFYPAWRASNLQPVEALRYEGGGAEKNAGWMERVGNQSFRNLWRRRNRTLLAATGIGIGVATLVMLGGLTGGMIGQLNNLAGSGGAGHLTVMQRDVPDMSLSSLDERIVNQLQAMPQVKTISPMVLGFVMTDELPLFILQGIDPNSAAIDHYKLTTGRYVRRPSEIVIGSNAANTYNLAINDTLTLYSNRYKIVGIYETGVAWEEGGGLLALREAQRLLNRPRSVSFIFVDVVDPGQAEAVRDAINQRFSSARASISSEFAQNTDDIGNMQAMAGAIGLLALVVGGIVVVNTMIMSIYERTREIGTLRALGWPSRLILSQVMQESVLLCLLSALLGSGLGVLLMMLFALIPGYGSLLKPVWDADTFLQAIGLMVVLGVLGGLYPAWRASRLKPVEALQYE